VGDVVYVVLMVAFFAVAIGLVWVCERIIGAGEAVPPSTSAERTRQEVAA
jgi:hypothetical protein